MLLAHRATTVMVSVLVPQVSETLSCNVYVPEWRGINRAPVHLSGFSILGSLYLGLTDNVLQGVSTTLHAHVKSNALHDAVGGAGRGFV